MKLFAAALDYDGTIAVDDRIDPAIRESIAALRRRGICVLLATGRRLDDLRRVAGELHFVDAVIAENGGLLHFPDSGHTVALAPEVPAPLVDDIKRRALDAQTGQSLVDARAEDAPALLDAIRQLELPLVLSFNKSRVMVTGQGVSKGTGLRAALATLRLSPRSTIAMGDAENDHELLRLCEVGVAVPWASAALRNAADVRLAGDSPAAVAAYLCELAKDGELPALEHSRRQLRLGHREDGTEFSLAIRGRNMLIAGDSRSGKSWVAGLIAEQLILHGYCVCVIDPEGDYRSLESLPGVSVFGGEEPPPTPLQLSRALRYPDRSIVIDLSHLPQDAKASYTTAILPALNAMRRHNGLPHRIVIDEAHYFLHDPDGTRLLDLERNGYTLVTYCASRLPKALLDATEVMVVTCESNPAEVAALCKLCGGGTPPNEWDILRQLRQGQAAVLPRTDEAGGRLQIFNVAGRITPHVRHRQKYVDVPVSSGQAFVFDTDGPAAPRRVRTLRQFVNRVERMSMAEIEPYVKRADFSRWIGDVFADHALAADLRVIETTELVHIHPDVGARIADAVRSRYDLLDEPVAASV